MSAGTEDGGGLTEVGDRCFFMVGAHVAHDCKVGNQVVFANNVLLAGHVHIGDHVVFGGGVAVRQFVRIGEGAMIVGLSGVRADVIPYGMAHGPLADLIGLNVVGMRRRGASKADIHRVRAAYQAHTLVQMLYGQMALGQGWPIQSYPYTGPLANVMPSPLQMTTPWTGDERCGVGWMFPRWH